MVAFFFHGLDFSSSLCFVFSITQPATQQSSITPNRHFTFVFPMEAGGSRLSSRPHASTEVIRMGSGASRSSSRRRSPKEDIPGGSGGPRRSSRRGSPPIVASKSDVHHMSSDTLPLFLADKHGWDGRCFRAARSMEEAVVELSTGSSAGSCAVGLQYQRDVHDTREGSEESLPVKVEPLNVFIPFEQQMIDLSHQKKEHAGSDDCSLPKLMLKEDTMLHPGNNSVLPGVIPYELMMDLVNKGRLPGVQTIDDCCNIGRTLMTAYYKNFWLVISLPAW